MTTKVAEDLYVLPASYGQERLWLLEQVTPDTPLYNVPMALGLRGRLDGEALAGALSGLVERHEVLRTVLQMRDGGVMQVVREARPLVLATEPVDASDEAVAARIQELAALPFDLAEGPLLRGHLLRVSDEHHVLVVIAHHTVTDGWSMGVMLTEIAALYAAAVEGGEAVLPEVPVQYADYALWQREQIEGGSLDEQIRYWRDRLAGVRPLALPVGGTEGAELPPNSSATAPLRIAPMTVRHLRGLAPAGVTPAMVAMAAYTAVLARWADQDDVVVALPVAGRGEPELESLVGFFVNTLPVRIDLSGDPTLSTLLERVREGSFGAYGHADVPFEVLVNELRPERRAGRTPLAQAMLAVNNTPLAAEVALPGVTGEPLRLPQGSAVFDVTVDLVESDNSLSGTVGLRADRFGPETADLLARSIGAALRAWATDPDTRLSELPCPLADRDSGVRAEPVGDAELRAGRSDTADSLPSNPTEHLLLELWSEEFGTRLVSVDEEFYALGGDSMRAVRIVMRAREKGVELPVEMVLGEHTVRQITSAMA
ncbi:condensation domain-containing protein [Nocardiopsis terrae]